VSTEPMARIAPLHPNDFSPELRELVGDDGVASPEHLGSLRVWARRPELAAAIVGFRGAVASASQLPPRLVELVRLRVAFHNQCRSCMAMRSAEALDDGMTEELVCELVRPEEAPDLTDRERAALAYADKLAVDHLGIDDGLFDRLRLHFTDEEIVELGLHTAIFIGLGRVAMSWDLVDDLPNGLRQSGTVGPWDAPGLVRPH
jgi:AhpD family alkylhydroperoxidase